MFYVIIQLCLFPFNMSPNMFSWVSFFFVLLQCEHTRTCTELFQFGITAVQPECQQIAAKCQPTLSAYFHLISNTVLFIIVPCPIRTDLHSGISLRWYFIYIKLLQTRRMGQISSGHQGHLGTFTWVKTQTDRWFRVKNDQWAIVCQRLHRTGH